MAGRDGDGAAHEAELHEAQAGGVSSRWHDNGLWAYGHYLVTSVNVRDQRISKADAEEICHVFPATGSGYFHGF